MTEQTTAEQPKTSHLSHQPKPVFALQKLAGFAEFAQICGTTQTRNRGTRYRYIGDEPLENAGSAGAGNAGANAGTTAAAKTRSRPNSEYVLYAQGEPVAVNADGDTSYFGTDILGSVRSVTDKYGNVKASYEYDAFGTPYLSNLENDVGFGYTGKIFDSDTGLYDYGFRDYAPNSARFTTVDPVRDGSNWFSYVVNDPVNYIDPFGLTPTDAGNTSFPTQTVQKGDTIADMTWSFNKKNGTHLTTSEVAAASGKSANPNLIYPGEIITFPVATPATASDTGSTISAGSPAGGGAVSGGSNGGGAGNVSMGGGNSSSSFASVGMNTGGQNTTTPANTPTEAVAQAATPSVNNDTNNTQNSRFNKKQFNSSSIEMLGGFTEFIAGYYTGNLFSMLHGGYNFADGITGIVFSLCGEEWDGYTSKVTYAILNKTNLPVEIKEMAVLSIECIDIFISDVYSADLSDVGKIGQLTGNMAKIWNSINDIACNYAEVDTLESNLEIVQNFILYMESLR